MVTRKGRPYEPKLEDCDTNRVWTYGQSHATRRDKPAERQAQRGRVRPYGETSLQRDRHREAESGHTERQA